MLAAPSTPTRYCSSDQEGRQSQPRPLSGRTALVTGSTRGIGLGIARSLVRAGAQVVLHGRRADRVRPALTEADGAVLFVAADLREPAAAAELVSRCEARFGHIDVLVNNAGVQHVCAVESFADEHWDEIMSLNLSAGFRTIRAALPGMRRRGWGRIVNIASVHGLVASVHKCAYVAAKHGLVGLTKAVALECAGDGVTCNAVCPGWVLTDLVQAQVERIAVERELGLDRAAEELLSAKQPMRRFSTPEAIGELVVFLCSEAASTTTGAALAMDGGWTSV